MNTKPFVAIRCMTYNHAPYITDAMNGFCMQQTTFPYVAIIVDDASTDEEPEVIKDYLNNHFDMPNAQCWETDDAHFIEASHKENKNCTFAVVLLKYNFFQLRKDKKPLISHWDDSAKYIALCEGDDYWNDSAKLQMQVEFMESHPDFFVCSHNFNVLYQHSQKVEEQNIEVEYISERNKRIYIYDKENFYKKWVCSTLTVLYKNTNYLENVDFSGFKRCWDFVDRYFMMEYGKGAFFSDVMATYRKHEGGVYSGNAIIKNYELELDQLYSLYHIRRRRPILHDAIIKRMVGALSLLRASKEYGKICQFVSIYIQRMPIFDSVILFKVLTLQVIYNLKTKIKK